MAEAMARAPDLARWLAEQERAALAFHADLVLRPAVVAHVVQSRTEALARDLHDPRLKSHLQYVAVWVLEGEKDCPIAKDPTAAAALYEALRNHAPKALAAARLPSPDEAEAEARRVLDDPAAVFAPDQRLEDYLRRTLRQKGPADHWIKRAEERAEDARKPPPARLIPDQPDPLDGARERPGILWAGWWSGPAGTPIHPERKTQEGDPGAHWATLLGLALWHGKVRSAVAIGQKKRAANESKRTAATVRTIALFSDLQSRTSRLDGAEIKTAAGRPVGELRARGLSPEVVEKLAEVRPDREFALAWLHALQVCNAAHQQGEGGRPLSWPSWAAWVADVERVLGERFTPEQSQNLRKAAVLGSQIVVSVPGSPSRQAWGLWLVEGPKPDQRGRPKANEDRRVTFTYADFFHANWAARENEADKHRGTKLVQLPDGRWPIDTTLANTDLSPAWNFTLRVVAYVAKGLGASHGAGVQVDPSTRRELAGRAGLSEAGELKQLRALVRGTEDAPPMLVQLDEDHRYTLVHGSDLAKYKKGSTKYRSRKPRK